MDEEKGCLKGCLIAFAVATVIVFVLLYAGLTILTATKKIDKADCVSEVSLTTSEEAVLFLVDSNPNSVDVPERHYHACIDDSYGADKSEYCKTRHTSKIALEVPLGIKVYITGRVKGIVPFSSWTYNRQQTLYFEAKVNNQKFWIRDSVMKSFNTPELGDVHNEKALAKLGFHVPSLDSLQPYSNILETGWQCGKY